MSWFTLAYVSRIELFAFAALMVQGALVFMSWCVCQRTAVNAAVETRSRLACAHFAALLLLPLLSIAILLAYLATDAVRTVGAAPILAAAALRRGGSEPIAPALALLLVWSSGVLVMLMRLAAALYMSTRQSIEPAAPALATTVRRLAGDWVRFPTVAQSHHLHAPEVRGLGRALLVAPINFDGLLTERERDAVLLHELAHVKRADFEWNLLQRLSLVLVWFHPAAWAIYAGIRREREACCDAIAVRRGANRHALARALVRLADRNGPGAVGIGAANSGELTSRVQRLIDVSRPAPRTAGANLTGAIAAILCLLSLAVTLSVSHDPLVENLFLASAFGPTITVTARDAAGDFTLNIRSGRVVRASLGERRLQPQQILQSGQTVSLVDDVHKTPMILTVTPSDKVSWTARHDGPAD
jgi:beta-lactamase regulating signal transducer with metallopeptidase domain